MGRGEDCDAILGDCGGICFDWSIFGSARGNYLGGPRRCVNTKVIGLLER